MAKQKTEQKPELKPLVTINLRRLLYLRILEVKTKIAEDEGRLLSFSDIIEESFDVYLKTKYIPKLKKKGSK